MRRAGALQQPGVECDFSANLFGHYFAPMLRRFGSRDAVASRAGEYRHGASASRSSKVNAEVVGTERGAVSSMVSGIAWSAHL